ncbi:MAG: GNAT family N-acetyltransferase [Devosia sp.]|nr:GNAT family N-acetyltransferase [Devosia sp.]
MADSEIVYRLDPFPTDAELARIWRAAWGQPWTGGLHAVLPRSIVHACAYDGDLLVGFVNVAWDGGKHAFLLDPTVDVTYQRRGIGRELIRRATDAARERGAEWLHVDHEPQLGAFYRRCGFRPTHAGLIDLRR